MATSITTHASKGGRLSHAEMDANFANLKSTADGAETAAAGKAAAVHSHAVADVTGLQTALDGKSATSHTHSNATTSAAGLMSSTDKTKLDGIASGATANTGTVTAVTGTAPIVSSGGTAPAISISAATTSAAGSMSAADKTKLDGVATGANNYSHPSGDGNLHVPATSTTNNGKVLKAGATAGSIAWGTLAKADVGLSSVDNTADSAKSVLSATKLATARTINGVSFDGSADITVADSTKIPTSEKGAANGVATLDGSGLVPASQLPSYVDDVLEYANYVGLPTTGEGGKIYVAQDTNKIYRWSGSAYIEVSPTAGNADTATKLATARTISLTGDVTGSVSFDGSANAAISATISANSVALGTDTTGNYVAGATAGTGISISGTAGEGWSPTITNTAPNVTTDISITHNASTVVVNSSDGADGTINAATTSAAGAMSSADKTKLDGLANYSHPSGDGNLHVPATGTTNNGKVLTAGATAGSLSWVTPAAAPVTSVAGKTGAVTLTASDVGAAATSHTHSDYHIAGDAQLMWQ